MPKPAYLVILLILTACTQTPFSNGTESLHSSSPTEEATSGIDFPAFEGPTFQPILIELVDPKPIEIELPSLQSFDGIGSLYQDQGVFYALMGGFDSDTQYYYVYQAVSEDGLEWVYNESDLTANDLFEGGNCTPRELLRTNAQWMYYAQCSEGTNPEESAYMIHLTAPEFTGPWTWHPGPIVGGNKPEDQPLWFLNIAELNPGYRMYFYYPITHNIGVAESNDGIEWQVLGEGQQNGVVEPVFTLQNPQGEEISARRIEVVWREGEMWYMIYLELRSADTSMESYTPMYRLATSPNGLQWIRSAEVILPDIEGEPSMIVTSMLATDSKLVATLCRWADDGGMSCYLGEAGKPVLPIE